MPLKSMPTIWIAIAGLVCAIGALLIVPGGVGAASPECPSTWPQGQDPASSPDQGLGHIQFEDVFDDSNDDQWFIIRSSDSNGYTTIRAYPAAQGDGGYITDSPEEVCCEEFAGLDPLQRRENFTIYRRGPAYGTTFLAFNTNPNSNPAAGDFHSPNVPRYEYDIDRVLAQQ